MILINNILYDQILKIIVFLLRTTILVQKECFIIFPNLVDER